MEPTSVYEVVPSAAAYKGTLDASGDGAGDIWVTGRNIGANCVESEVPPGSDSQASY